MGDHALSEFTDLEGIGTLAPASMPVSSMQKVAPSNPIDYTPPPQLEMDVATRLERGFVKGVASTPQILGQGLFYLGQNFHPDATKEELIEGNSFADRTAKLGIELMEKNQKYLTERFPEVPDVWEKIGQGVGGVLPLAAGLAIGSVTGADEAVVALIGAGVVGSTVNIDTFAKLKAKGTPTLSADLLSILPAGVAGGLAYLGIGNFLSVAGAPLAVLAKSVINGAISMTSMTVATGEIQHLEGVNPESLKERISQYAIDGVVGGIIGGAGGVHLALRAHAEIEANYQKLGLSKSSARDATNKMMNIMTAKGLDIAEGIVGNTAEKDGRLKVLPQFKVKPVDATGTPRTDILDEPYIPKEPSKAEKIQTELESKLAEQRLIRKDISELQSYLAEHKEMIDALKAETEVRRAELTKVGEARLIVEAQAHMENLQKDAEVLKSQISALREKLAPKQTAIQSLGAQLSRLKAGLRIGKFVTKNEIEDIQKQFIKMLDKSDLELNDKAKFLKTIPKLQNAEKFQENLPELQARVRILEEKAERREWIKDIKDIDMKKLPIEYQDALQPILDSFDFSNPSKAKIIVRGQTIEFFREKLSQNEPLTPGEEKALDDASRLSIPEILQESNGHECLRAIHEAIMQMVKIGEYKNKLLSAFKQRNFDESVNEYLKRIATKEGIERLSTAEKALKLAGRPFWKKLFAKGDAILYRERHMDLLFHILHADEDAQLLHEAFQQKIELDKQYGKSLESIHDMKNIGKMYHDKNDISIKLGDETRIFEGVTGNQLLKVYAQSFEEDSIAHIRNTWMRPTDSVDTGNRILDTLIKKAVQLYPDECKAVEKQFDYFDKTAEALDKVKVDLTGSHLRKVDFYDPLIGLETRSGRAIEEEMKWTTKGMLDRAEVASGFTNTRVKSELAIKNLDYYGDLEKNAMARANYISLAKIMRDLNMKYQDPRIIKGITDRFGPDAIDAVHTLLKDVAMGGSQHYRTIDRVLSQLRSSFIYAKIGLNFGSSGKVFSQLSPAADYVGGNWVPKATMEFTLNMQYHIDRIQNDSLQMRNMWLRQERDFGNLIKIFGSSDSALLNARDWIAKKSMIPHLMADMYVRYITYLAQEMKVIEGDPIATKEQIVASAEAAVRWTHPMGGTLYLPESFRGNEFEKAITTFLNAPNRNLNLLMKAHTDVGEGVLPPVALVKKYISIGVIPAIIVAGISLRRMPSLREAALELLTQTAGAEVYMGIFTRALMYGREAGVTFPYADLVNESIKVLTAKEAGTKVKHGLSAMDDILGTPIGNLIKDFEGLNAILHGEFKGKPPEGIGKELDKEQPEDNSNPFSAGRV